MRWLLWKDYRQNRLILIFGLFFFLVPYLLVLYAACYAAAHGSNFPWPEALVAASLWSLVLSQLTIGFVAGNAIAGERVDRSADFLASLPVSRRRSLVSKVLLLITVVTAIWATNGVTFWILGGIDIAVRMAFGPSAGAVLYRLVAIAVSGVAISGVAWSLSSVMASPTVPVCGGLMTP